MESFMELALEEAKSAGIKDEVPVGAIIVNEKGIVAAKSGNRMRELNDPTAHAEILAIRHVCKIKKTEKLFGYNIYVTLQPCEMCLQAIINTKISRLYYGAPDITNQMLQKKYDMILSEKSFNLEIYSNINEKKCSIIVKNFFKNKRK